MQCENCFRHLQPRKDLEEQHEGEKKRGWLQRMNPESSTRQPRKKPFLVSSSECRGQAWLWCDRHYHPFGGGHTRTTNIPASSRFCFHGSASGFHGSLQLLCNLVILGGRGSQLTWRGDQSDGWDPKLSSLNAGQEKLL